MIQENLAHVRERIAIACAGSGRSENEVKLVAVSKFKPVSDIEEAIGAGQTVFGENRCRNSVTSIRSWDKRLSGI